MINKIFLIAIILIGLSSIISAQQKFRNAIFLHLSVGGNIYDQGYANTNVPNECTLYNVAHSYTGADAVSMDQVLFPWNNSGNAWYEWRAVFDGTDPDDDIYQYINAYDIIIIKTCYTVGMPVYWWEGSQDTTVYPHDGAYYTYQWHLRHIVNIMGQHPDKFFVIWTPAPRLASLESSTEAGYRDAFAYWMTDTLAAGNDDIYNSRYGAFPPNVHMYDYFHNIDFLTYMPLSLAASPTDNHPNALGTELIAPLFVNDVFNAAILYEINYPLPVELSTFSATVIGSSIQLNWRTETEINNYGFGIERSEKLDAKSETWEKIGFVNGNGNSNSPKNYLYIDEYIISGKYSYRLKQIDIDGQFEYSEVVEVDFNPIAIYTLEQNYPNPFNPSTEINFTLAKAGSINLIVYDCLGTEVTTLADGFMNSGKHSVKFNAKDFSTGIYFYRITADNFTSTRKMLLIK